MANNDRPALDDDYIAAIVKMALEKDREERDRQSRLATEAAVAAALANQTCQVQALRKNACVGQNSFICLIKVLVVRS